MKKGIHPKYFETAVKCGCGATFTTRSTQRELRSDCRIICHTIIRALELIFERAVSSGYFRKNLSGKIKHYQVVIR